MWAFWILPTVCAHPSRDQTKQGEGHRHCDLALGDFIVRVIWTWVPWPCCDCDGLLSKLAEWLAGRWAFTEQRQQCGSSQAWGHWGAARSPHTGTLRSARSPHTFQHALQLESSELFISLKCAFSDISDLSCHGWLEPWLRGSLFLWGQKDAAKEQTERSCVWILVRPMRFLQVSKALGKRQDQTSGTVS